MVTAAALVASMLGLSASPALAAPATVSTLDVTVSQDGTAPFDTGFDGGPNNGIAPANDKIKYRVNATFAELGDVTFTATLPAGMRWDSTSSATSVCSGPGGGNISSDLRTLSCDRTVTGASESFEVLALTTDVASGTTVTPEVSAGGVTAVAPGVQVLGAPRLELRTYVDTPSYSATVDGQPGYSWRIYLIPGLSGDMRGSEAVQAPRSFTFEVAPGVVPVNSTSGIVMTQPGGPGTPITVSHTRSFSQADFATGRTIAVPTGYATLPSASNDAVWLGVQFGPHAPADATTMLVGGISGFDPDSLSGQSNFGSGVAPGLSPADVCPAAEAIGSQIKCFTQRVDRTVTNGVVGQFGMIMPRSGGPVLLGDNHTTSDDLEKVTPGQRFGARFGIINRSNAPQPAADLHGCAVWDPNGVELVGGARGLRSAVTSDNNYQTAYAAVDAAVLVEYTTEPMQSDNARRAFDCFDASNGAIWGTDPTALGGIANVTAVRYSDTRVLNPGTVFGVDLSLRRTVAPQADGTALPIFHSFGSDAGEHPSAYAGQVRRIDGASVQAVEALVRHRIAFDSGSAAPGGARTLSITPWTIGPVGDPATAPTTARNVRATITLDSTCVSPVYASLQEAKDDGRIDDFTITPANPGTDGVLCTADDGAPASIELVYGDLDAPAGPHADGFALGGLAGHQSEHAGNRVQLRLQTAVTAANSTTVRATSVISASNDPTPAISSSGGYPTQLLPYDRTETADLQVSGASSFVSTLGAVTAAPGYAAPGETFAYAAAWGNMTQSDIGPGKFVLVLPFDDDPRGTNGLGGALRVTDVSTSSTGGVGQIDLQYTIDDADDVYASVNVNGQENGDTGIQWLSAANPADVPSDGSVTALRFVTQNNIHPSSVSTARVTVQVPVALAYRGGLGADLFGRTQQFGGTSHAIRGNVGVHLQATTARIEGDIVRDLDFSGDLSTGDGAWPQGAQTVEIVETTTAQVVATANVAANGDYSASVPGAGSYEVRLVASEATSWQRILPTAPLVVASGSRTEDHRVLYQEQVADPELRDDPMAPAVLRVAQGRSIVIDVTQNDTRPMPTAPGSATPAPIVFGASAQGGTVVSSILSPDNASYTASDEWPASATGLSYLDTFTYSWTNARGVNRTATVTVNVVRAAAAVDDEATISQTGEQPIDVLSNDAGDGIRITGATRVSGDATIAHTQTGISVLPTHIWGADETIHAVQISYEITDSEGGTSNAVAIVTVQRAPMLSGAFSRTIAVGGSATGLQAIPLNPSTIPATGGYAITEPPSSGTASVADNGDVVFDAEGAPAGEYRFTVTATDDRGQTGVREYVVTVQAVPLFTGSTSDRVGSQAGTTVAQFDVEVRGTTPQLSFTGVPSGAAEPSFTGGELRWDTAGLVPGDYGFTAVATDDLGQRSQTLVFSVTVFAQLEVEDQSAKVGTTAATSEHEFVETITGGDGNVARSITTQPAHGQARLGSVIYSSAEGGGIHAPRGVYTTEVTYTDGVGQTATAAYRVRVQPAPTGAGAHVRLHPEDEFVTVDPIGNTLGEELQPISADSIVTGPKSGTAEVTGELVAYTPRHGFAGTDRFTVRVCDDLRQCVDLDYAVELLAVTEENQGGLSRTGGGVPDLWTALALAAAGGGILLILVGRGRIDRSSRRRER